VNRSVEKLDSVSGEDTAKFISAAGAGREEPEPEEAAAGLDEPGEVVAASCILGLISHDTEVSPLACPSDGFTKRISPGSRRLGTMASNVGGFRASSCSSAGRFALRIGREANRLREAERSHERTLSADLVIGMRVSPR
jgi:hypothetical protein